MYRSGKSTIEVEMSHGIIEPGGAISKRGDIQRRARQRAAMIVGVSVILLVGYVLSFAPAYRYMQNGDLPSGGVWRVYAPVNWLIDMTILREPLLDWADYWGVRFEFETTSDFRAILREDPLE